jgi:DNA repair protein RadB
MPASPILKLFNGKIEEGCITNFYGVPASGKTQVCLAITAYYALRGHRIAYIDTESGFSFERFRQICGDRFEETLENIYLLEPCTWKELRIAIRKLESLNDVSLVVVDSMVALWRVELDKDNVHELSQDLARQLCTLNRIARKRNIPVVITSQVYSDIEKGTVEISGGDVVKWWSKNLVELIHAGRNSCRIAIVKKARFVPEGRKVEFEITKSGLKEVRFRLF